MVAQPTGFGDNISVSAASNQRTPAEDLQAAGLGIGYLGLGTKGLAEAAKLRQFINSIGPAAKALQDAYGLDPEVAQLLAVQGLDKFDEFQKGITELTQRQGAEDFAGGLSGDALYSGIQGSNEGIANASDILSGRVPFLGERDNLTTKQTIPPELPFPQENLNQFNQSSTQPFIPDSDIIPTGGQPDIRQLVAAAPGTPNAGFTYDTGVQPDIPQLVAQSPVPFNLSSVDKMGGPEAISNAINAPAFLPGASSTQEIFNDSLLAEGETKLTGGTQVFLPPSRTPAENTFIGLNYEALTKAKQNLDSGTKTLVDTQIALGKAPSDIAKSIADASKSSAEAYLLQKYGPKLKEKEIDYKSAQIEFTKAGTAEKREKAKSEGALKISEIKTAEEKLEKVKGFNNLNPKERDTLVRKYLEFLKIKDPGKRKLAIESIFNAIYSSGGNPAVQSGLKSVRGTGIR